MESFILETILAKLDTIDYKLDGKVTKGWLDLTAASKYCSLSPSTIRRSIRSGQLKTSKSTGKLMFKIEWLDKWLNG
jgi:hypothetical protein